MNRRGRKRWWVVQPRAFTMLELLIAMAMTAMVAMSLYASMRVSLRARRTATDTVRAERASTFAIDMICRDLESVPPPTGTLAGPFLGTRQAGSTGEADYLQFYCLGSDGDEPKWPLHEGMRMVELVLRTDVTPPVLVRRVTRNLLAAMQAQPEEEILCRGVRSFALQYFDGTTWQQQWDSTAVGDVLPFAVQVLIELDPSVEGSPDSTPIRIVRTIPLACAKSADTSATDGSSGGTGGTSGTGARSGGTGGTGTTGGTRGTSGTGGSTGGTRGRS